MPLNVVMPALEMAQETGKILAWLKKEGEPVSKGEWRAGGRGRDGERRGTAARGRPLDGGADDTKLDHGSTFVRDAGGGRARPGGIASRIARRRRRGANHHGSADCAGGADAAEAS